MFLVLDGCAYTNLSIENIDIEVCMDMDIRLHIMSDFFSLYFGFGVCVQLE